VTISPVSAVSVTAGATAVALFASAMYEHGAFPPISIHAPAVGVDAAATPGSAGSAVASYQRSIVSTEFVADVLDCTIPNRVAPDVVTIICPTTLFAGRFTASVVNVPAAGASRWCRRRTRRW
jgi:hypothetical protein